MRSGLLVLGLALGMPALAHADDWLAGEYDVVVPDHPAPSRYVLVIERGTDGQYRDDVFKRSGDAGSMLTRIALDGLILGPDYFAAGMEVGPIEIHKRTQESR